MARRSSQRSAASFRVDGKQFVHLSHNRSCNRVTGIQLHRLEKLSSGMGPTSCVYHSRPTDLLVGRISVGLENAFELSQEPLRPIASTTQTEVEHHGSSGATVLPQIRLVILSSALACLDIDWGFIGLYVSSANQLSPHRGDHPDRQFAYFQNPAVKRRSADFQADVSFEDHTLPMQRRVVAILADNRVDDDAVTRQAFLDDPWRQGAETTPSSSHDRQARFSRFVTSTKYNPRLWQNSLRRIPLLTTQPPTAELQLVYVAWALTTLFLRSSGHFNTDPAWVGSHCRGVASRTSRVANHLFTACEQRPSLEEYNGARMALTAGTKLGPYEIAGIVTGELATTLDVPG
jgi:hypothetical protein